MNLSKLSNNQKAIVIGFIIGVISLFMTWVDAGIVAANGIDLEGYLILLVFIYPVLMTAEEKKYSKGLAIIVLLLGIVFMLSFIASKTIDIFGSDVNCAGSGMYVMVVGLIISLAGVIKDKK